ncbi:hypothetical protein H9L19_08055 [Weissella diestrammenae]|uniref:Uncharacterized protein n=1 Tax=Weissella diestrammenae TaxID=1162633 RepID=A0A7G9T5C7_9LACO|nr:hypothetical protein [Weissella diestrammenae]MCM0583161.1 hypothetical protein [Weissella diestrammenae]QNN75302.1 hypothetical protein H9L19_08055 [Weissella diestrammenae]
MKNRSERHANPKSKGKRRVKVFIGVLITIAIVAFGALQLERYVVDQQAAKLVSAMAPATTTKTTAGTISKLKLAASTPEQIATRLNENESGLVARSKQSISSAEASTSENGIIYTIATDKLNTTTVNMLLSANGDQVKQMAKKIVSSMADAGTNNPKMTINIVDSNGKLIKQLVYTN